jgi:DNA-binding IclR family transcriptional regulator
VTLAGAEPLESGRIDLATSVGKALALLDAFDSPAAALGVTELARRAGLPKSTAFRLLAALEAGSFVERNGNRWCLGRRLFELGNLVSYCRPRNLRDVALPFLSDLYELTHETVHLAVLEGIEVLYVEKLYGHNKVRTPSQVGGRVPAHCSALGKAMLAYADEATVAKVIAGGLDARTPYTIVVPSLFRAEIDAVRREGVAFDREEATLGLTCVAAAVFRDGRAVAAVSVSGHSSRFVPAAIAGAVRKAATGIAAELGG